MIKVPTVLILGAGASNPYKFPTGEELKEIICGNLSKKPNLIGNLQEAGFSLEEIRKFQEEFFYTGVSSVDAFLERRQKLIPIGKAAIAQALIPYENADDLFGIKDWYQYLFEKLMTSFEDFGKNKLGIITYNYDRSLEYFLITSMKNLFEKSETECRRKLKEIRFVHIHGSLGNYLVFGNDHRDYSNISSPANIKLAASNIKIIHEEIKEQYQEAHQMLLQAERICFLGFGYHELNIKRLVPQNMDQKNRFVSGTAYRKKHIEKIDIKELVGMGLRVDKYDHSILDFLKKTGILTNQIYGEELM